MKNSISDINFEVDSFWLSTNCFKNVDIIWIHKDEKSPWKENKGTCSCEKKSRVRCELEDPIIIGNTIYPVLIMKNRHYYNL